MGAWLHKDSARRLAIEAKYLRPRIDHVSLRPDVRETLAVAFGRRLTVVCAPAGYGKTTTTAAALQQCDCSSAWYKLDILDHDPLAFLAGVVRAVRRAVPDFGESLLRELESGPVLEVSAGVLAARLCSDCDRLVATDLHLVLDDYHEAMDAPAMNDVLGYLLETCPSTIHFVVLTRYEPVFRLEKLNLAGEVARVSRDLLLFDAGQVADVLRQRSGRRHDPEHVRKLLVLTEGWPASVVLAGMTLVWLDADSLEDALSDPRLRTDVFSYLAEQVFQRQTAEVQRFLLRTSCLDQVSVPVAERLTGTDEAARHLHFLARNHVFTFNTGHPGRYRYHNLLRDFLRQRFVQDKGESSFHALQRDTAVALEGCGDRPGAIELLLGANELSLALEAVGRGGEGELERRPSEQLRIWLDRLSSAVDERQPWALVVSGVIGTRENRFDGALNDLRDAAAALERKHDGEGLYQVLSILEWTEFWSGDSSASMKTCYRALERATTDAERLHTLLSLLSAALDMRRWEAVATASSRADPLLPRARPEEAARAQALQAHAAFYQGDMRSAHELIRRCRVAGQTNAQRAASLNTHGMIDTALGKYFAASQHLREAADAAEDFGYALTSYIEDNVAFLDAAQGDFGAALLSLEALTSDTEGAQEAMLLAFSLCHHGTVLRRSGDLDASLGPTALALETIPADRDPYLALNAAANLAFAEGLLGAERQAALRGLSGKAASAGLRFVELKAQLYAGILAHTEADPAEAVDLLEHCLPRQLELGHINLIAQELSPRPDLASLVLRRHRSNGLGPPLLDALSHHWGFPEASLVLKEQCASQVGTWIDHIAASHAAVISPLPAGHPPSSRHVGGTRAIGAESELAGLTIREREVLRLMAQDLSNEEIAGELFIALSTVKTHVNHVLRKLGQTNRLGAVLEYQRLAGSIDALPARHRPHLHPSQ